jgi:hypothetical protein
VNRVYKLFASALSSWLLVYTKLVAANQTAANTALATSLATSTPSAKSSAKRENMLRGA